MSKNHFLYQNHIHQSNSMPTSSSLQSLNLKVDPPRTLRKLIHNKKEIFFAVCASKHTQQILLTMYAYQHTQQSKQIFLLCMLASIHSKKNCLIAVYASKHTQQIDAYQCHLPLLLPTCYCYKSLLPRIYNLAFSMNLQSSFSNKYATSIQCFSFGISTTTFYPKQIE